MPASPDWIGNPDRSPLTSEFVVVDIAESTSSSDWMVIHRRNESNIIYLNSLSMSEVHKLNKYIFVSYFSTAW